MKSLVSGSRKDRKKKETKEVPVHSMKPYMGVEV